MQRILSGVTIVFFFSPANRDMMLNSNKEELKEKNKRKKAKDIKKKTFIDGRKMPMTQQLNSSSEL